jgi:putative nucleotidyltransferase with HDIG domain
MMTDRTQRMQLYVEIVQRMSAALRAASMYAVTHPSVAEHVRALFDAVQRLHRTDASALVGFIGGEIVADDTPLLAVTTYRTELIRYMQALGINRVQFDRGVTLDELNEFVRAVSHPAPAAPRAADDPQGGGADVDFLKLDHVRAGRIPVDTSSGTWGSKAVTLKRLYSGSVEAARMVWESTSVEGKPDAPAAHDAVNQLADALDSSRSTMIGLTGMRAHDEYTFTHMVNVSILTMAQARTLGVEGQALRELGLAAMLHDIGKVRTPLEVLNKPGALTPDERSIMRRHPADGAAILRATPDLPKLSAVVAFEHHLRADDSGYPTGVRRAPINAGTVLCSIADAYDAMRTTRVYQEATPAARIMDFIANKASRQFDRHLVRRFIHLMGVYPPATLVRLTDGSAGIVIDGGGATAVTVRVLFEASGARLASPRLRQLAQAGAGERGAAPLAVDAPLDPSLYDIEPGDYL